MKKKKVLFVGFVVFLIALSTAALTVYAASDTYSSTLAFQGELTGQTRAYNHKNISFSATAYCTQGGKTVGSNSKYAKTYRVSLYRKTGWFSSEKVGSCDLSRYSYGSACWTNVGSGNYYFYFTKARDGVNVNSKNVVMKGY